METRDGRRERTAPKPGNLPEGFPGSQALYSPRASSLNDLSRRSEDCCEKVRELGLARGYGAASSRVIQGPHEWNASMTTQSSPSIAHPIISSSRLRRIGLSLMGWSLLSGGCISHDWAMGRGTESTGAAEQPKNSDSTSTKDQDPDADTPSVSTGPSSKAPDQGNSGDPDQGANNDSDPGPDNAEDDPQEQNPGPDGNPQEDSQDTSTQDPDTFPEDPGADTSSESPDSEPLPQDPDTFPEDPGADTLPEDPEPSPPRCGDGIIQSNEECDDGNSSNNDACLSNCKLARCGDMWVWEGREECDPGPHGNATQMASCADVCGQFSEPIIDARAPTRTCFGSGDRACTGGPWDCRGCRDPNQ